MKKLTTIAALLMMIAFTGAAFATTDEDSGWRARLTVPLTNYNTSGVKMESIPVNPQDSSFLHGNTNVRAKNGTDCAVQVGVAKAFEVNGWKGQGWSIAPVVGLDLQFSFLSGEQEDPDATLMSTKQQSSDRRPAAQGSFVYDRLTPGVVSPIPFVGLEINCGNWVIAPELGIACKEFTRESGDYRCGEFSPTAKTSQWAISPKPLLKISYKFGSNEIGAFASYETYHYSFGTISGVSFGPAVAIRF